MNILALYRFHSNVVLSYLYCTDLLSAMNRQQSLSSSGFCPKIPQKEVVGVLPDMRQSPSLRLLLNNILNSTAEDFKCN